MVQINFAQKEIQCKIVYYGPGMSGKTTNLELVHAKAPEEHRGELTSIATTGERTLYFDYMPLDLGQIAGISTKFQLYTVPGQIYYKSTRRLVLQGVDGIVFVADSSAAKLRENKESLADLEDNLKEMGKSLQDVPIVIQYNKRDLPDAMPVDDLEKELNALEFPSTEATATLGEGVFPTLKQLAGMVLEAVNRGGLATARAHSSRREAKKQKTTVAAAGAPAAPLAATVRGSAGSARRRPSSPARGGGMPAGTARGAAPRPPAPRPGRQPERAVVKPPPARPRTAYAARSLQERVVPVGNLRARGDSKILVLVTLGLLIAGAIAFVASKL